MVFVTNTIKKELTIIGLGEVKIFSNNTKYENTLFILEKVKLIAAEQLNVFDLLNANSIILGEDALGKIQEVYGDD